ncbi:MAG TPA: galactose-1-epimerase [Gemmatimonadales bacterium]
MLSLSHPVVRLPVAILLALTGTVPRASAQAAPLVTRWAADVTPDHVLPEYPRPQMVRAAWTNLNGRWEYAIADSGVTRITRYDGTMLVPFPVQSTLSGVRRAVSPAECLWYHRRFTLPSAPAHSRWLLHFGAVDWDAVVFVNGRRAAEHRGGYDPFTIDITPWLRGAGPQDLVLRVWDPTDAGEEPRGKQVLHPESIWYTAVTGIWQTVWLEPVPAAHIEDLDIVPDLDAGSVTVRVRAPGAGPRSALRLTVRAGDRVAARGTGTVARGVTAHIPQPRPWSPDDPFLYDLRVSLGSGDSVASYVGMRKIAIGRDSAGTARLFLNNRPLFEFGVLDQGWWPDGLYTAPTDAALRSDLETLKGLGYNLVRKHVKVEPDRWYYDADRLGMLVWQDMPSGDIDSDAGRREYAAELARIVDARRNHPAIVMWVPFNEGWGQHDTRATVAWLKHHDPTRLVDNASGWTDRGVGDVADVHAYPGPEIPPRDPRRALVLGEFGGLGLPLAGHTWLDANNWGYRRFGDRDSLWAAYRDLIAKVRALTARGLAAAVYTQATDVEIEVNGVMTYDRAVVKLPPEAAALNRTLYGPPPQGGSVTRAPFGTTSDGHAVDAFTLTNAHGLELRVLTYGGIIQSLRTPDRDGRLADVVLGFDSLPGYETLSPYFGAIVGRYANRIAGGRFTLDGVTHQLARNNGPNALHGGLKGFDKVVWDASPFTHGDSVGIVLSHLSPDGDEGYPGALTVHVTYMLTPDDHLVVDYDATTDRATPLNLSQHSYFNLSGEGSGDILRHVLTIDADRYTPVDSTLIPTGVLAPVAGTPFDFRTPAPIGARIGAENEQLAFGRGYDHNFVLNRSGAGLSHAARLADPASGRTLDVFTTEPGLQFYSGNFLDGTIHGRRGHVYVHRGALCLETQHFPDSPNHPEFPNTILRPGEEFRSRTVFAFGVMR